MPHASLCISPAPSTASFSTARTSIPLTEITPPHYCGEAEEKGDHDRQKPQQRQSHQRREINNQTLLMSSPLTTLIYTASSTAAALHSTSTMASHLSPREVPGMNGKGRVLRKKRAVNGRPERLVRVGGPEIKVAVKSDR